MRNHARILAVALALSASGCSLMVDPAKNDPLETAEGFCNSIQDALDRLGCNVNDPGAPGIAPAALDQQLTSLRSSCDNLQALVDAGHFAYDQGNAEACLSALEARGCRSLHLANYGAWPLACTNALKGKVAPGGSCTYADTDPVRQGPYVALNECTQGSTCFSNDLATCGGGVCGFPSNVGESCGGNHYCQPYLYCDYYGGYVCRQYASGGQACSTSIQCAPDYYYCSGGSCAALPTAGQACAPGSGSKCRAGNWCNYNTNVCTAYVLNGGSCSYASNLYCADGTFCATDAICRYYSGEGGSCAPPYQCGSSSVSLYCDESSTCRRYPSAPVAQGASCYYVGTSFCADGLFCDSIGAVGAANTCQPKVGGGAPCSSYEMCANGYTCQYDPAAAGNTCRRLKGLGESCAPINYDYCQPGLWCDEMGSHTCKLPGGAGQPCATGGMQPCAPGSYPDYATVCTCRAYLGEGAACTSDFECGDYRTGRKCLTSGGPTSTCQTLSCRVPAGWLAGGSGGY